MTKKRSREVQKELESQKAWKAAQQQLRGVEQDVRIPAIGFRRVQVFYAPSFDPGFSWDIRESDGQYCLYRSLVVTHGMDYMLKGYYQLNYPSPELNLYFDRLRALSLAISPVYNNMTGADGTNFQLALFGDMWSTIRFAWWSDPPLQWKDLVNIAQEMI